MTDTPNADSVPTTLDSRELALLALAEMAKAQQIAKSGQTGVLGVNGRPAYHVARANVYATLALVAAQIEAPEAQS